MPYLSHHIAAQTNIFSSVSSQRILDAIFQHNMAQNHNPELSYVLKTVQQQRKQKLIRFFHNLIDCLIRGKIGLVKHMQVIAERNFCTVIY